MLGGARCGAAARRDQGGCGGGPALGGASRVVVRFAARLDGSAASDVVDFYEERRRSHRGHVRSREGGPSRRRRPQDASRKPLQCRVPQTLSRSQIARTTKSPSRGASSPRRSRRRIAAREAHREGEGAAAAVSVLFDGRATRGRAAGARRRGRPMSQVPENAVADGVLPLSVRGPEKDKRRVPGQG